MTPDLDSVVSGEQVVETRDGEICFWFTNEEASPITIGEDPVVGTADPVEEISPSSDIIATAVLKEVAARKEPPLAEPQLVPKPFLAFVPPDNETLDRAPHATAEDTSDLLAATSNLQQHAPTAVAPTVLHTLPLDTPPCPATPDALVAAVPSSDRLITDAHLFIVPPPPFAASSYRAVAPKLLAESDQSNLRATVLDRRDFRIEPFGRLLDRRIVDCKSGKWLDPDRALLRQHLLEMSAMRSLKFCQRPGPWPPPRFRQQSARRTPKSRRRSPPPTPG